jgi:DNA-directed RNA polymerase specialized sigma24 family protein
VWVFLVLLSAALLVAQNKLEELCDPNDPVEVTEWLVDQLLRRFGHAYAWDLVQEASERALPTGMKPWTEESGHTYALHLVYAVTDVHRRDVRRKDYKVEADDEDDHPLAPRAPTLDPESLMDMKNRHRRLYAAALAHFENSPKVLPVLERIFVGEWTSNEEHAKATGLSLDQVRNAKAQVVAFVEEWRQREDEVSSRSSGAREIGQR